MVREVDRYVGVSDALEGTGCHLNFEVLTHPITLRFTHEPIIRVGRAKNVWHTTVGSFNSLKEAVETHIQSRPTGLTSIWGFSDVEYCFIVVDSKQYKNVGDWDNLPYNGIEKLLTAHRAVLIRH